MPRRATYLLAWLPDQRAYELRGDRDLPVPGVTPDAPDWFAWLETATSFAFSAATGDACTVRKEAVQRGGAYWYAYRRVGGRMAKRYLGRGEDVTLARLEAAAASLSEPAPAGTLLDHAAAQPGERTGSPRGASGARSRVRGGRPARPPEISLPSPLLLATKLHPPRGAGGSVTRPHVLQRLQRGLERPLTLVAAPAGFGKTTSLRDWAALTDAPVAWVSLDAGDDDPAQFWAYALTALDGAQPGLAEATLPLLLASPNPPLVAVVRALLNAAATLPRDIALVLDDYHLIGASAIHLSLAAMLEHPPARLHLYLATRDEPPLPLARLRARDQVNEMRADDLRFRPDEVAAFLDEVMGIELGADDVMTLAERTDGWAAGLHLAGLGLRDHPEPSRFVASFGGGHRHVMTYLGEEVLAAQPAEVQSFLLRTALLERLCAPLCDAVTGRGDGMVMLERLERANLFVVPLDDEGRWYRYYHPFADLLRHRLRQTAGGDIPELHRRAARWLESEGWIVEAARHLLAAPDAAEAARVIEGAARGMIMRGEGVGLLRLAERLPEGAIAARPRLCLLLAAALLSVGDLDAIERHITNAEIAIALDPPRTEEEWRTLAGMLASTKASLAAMRGDSETAIALARAALDDLPEADGLGRGGAVLTLAHVYRHLGRMREADAAFAEATRLSLDAGNLHTATIALCGRALALTQQGRLRESTELIRRAIAVAEGAGGAARALAGQAYSHLGDLLYQWDDLEAARLAAEKALALGRQWENSEDQADGYTRMAFIYQAQGRAVEAAEAMRQAERIAREGPTVPWLPPLVGGFAARLALRQGHVEAAERWERERGLYAEGEPPERIDDMLEFELLTFARLLLAKGLVDLAARTLEPLIAPAETEGRAGSVVEICALLALAHQARGASEDALEALGRAVALARGEGYVRLFADEGAPMRGLLARLRERYLRGSAERRYLETLLAACDRTERPTALATAAAGGLMEPLSEREREVLRLLAAGRTNQEIARQLVVAMSTVKSHVHHVYAKLGAADRLGAVNRGRELGLVER